MGESALVTGASGFLGRHVVRDLRAHGYAVTAAGRRARCALRPARRSSVTSTTWRARTSPADLVVHCAALSSPWGRWSEFEHANVTGTARVLQLRPPRRGPADRARLVARIYLRRAARPPGDPGARGRPEPPDEPLHPVEAPRRGAPAGSRSGRSRGRRAAPARHHRRRRPRSGAAAAPRARAGRRAAAARGRGLVDLTAVENVALAVRLAAEVPDAAGLAVNVTNGDPRPFVDLLDQLLTRLGLPLRHRRLPRDPCTGSPGSSRPCAPCCPAGPNPR